MAVKVAIPPRGGLWRVGRSPDPISFGDPLPAELLDDARLGNRFDSPTQSYRVSYFSSSITGAVLRRELGHLLAYYDYKDLDVATVRGGDRRITRWIGKWAFDQRDADGRPVYAGVRYLSRLNSDWECWAVFEHAQTRELERKPILRSDRDLAKVARLYDLTVF